MYMKTTILALTFAALVAAAPVPAEEDVILYPSMFGMDDIDITPEQYRAELSKMLLEELPEGLTLNDIQGMSIDDINAVEEKNIQNEIAEYEAELQQILGLALEENSIVEDEIADFDLQEMLANSLVEENSVLQGDVSASNV